MTLADLQKMIENVNTLGFKPEDIQVKFQYTLTSLEVQHAITKVSADNKDVKPILQIDLR